LAVAGGGIWVCPGVGVPPTNEATKELVTRIGYVRESIFGGMWDFTANMAFKDTAYTSAAIDRTPTARTASIRRVTRCFHCLKFDGSGGESTLVDGFKIAEQIRAPIRSPSKYCRA